MTDQPIVVVGAGLGGALMAVYLGRAGHDVAVYERRTDPRRHGAARGRSINLALSTRGLAALAEVGVAEQVLQQAVAMRGRMMHPVRGKLRFQPYGTERHQVIHSVSRADLNATLLDAAERQGSVRLHFETRCTGVDLDAGAVELIGPDGGAASVRAAGVVGADGAFSAVRNRLQRLDGFDYAQSYLAHGYKELTIPPAAGGAFPLEPHALHIWPRGGFMMIALPNVDGSFTATLFWPFAGPNSFAALSTEREVRDHFAAVFPDAVPLMPDLAADFLESPIGSLVTIRCRPWHHAGRVVLLGDAAHAIVPFYGQGANAAFEDCAVLDECMRAHPGDRNAAFAAFERRRKDDVDALAELAVENFLEMRDRVASPLFRLRKRIEQALARAFPSWFLPLYAMVTFTRMPYALARRRARRQWRVVQTVCGALLVVLLLLVLYAVVGCGGSGGGRAWS